MRHDVGMDTVYVVYDLVEVMRLVLTSVHLPLQSIEAVLSVERNLLFSSPFECLRRRLRVSRETVTNKQK